MKTNTKHIALGLVLSASLILGGITVSAANENASFERPKLTDEQKEQLKNAAGDREKIKSLLQEFGVKKPQKALMRQNIKKNMQERKEMRQEKRDEVQKAIESGDFEAFKALHDAKDPILQKVNADNFPKFVELHNALKNGDTAKAESLAKELGLENFPPKGAGKGKMFGEKMQWLKDPAHKEKVKAVIESGDFEAFKALHKDDAPLFQKINADNFSKFVEMHKKMEEAKKLREELGIEDMHHGEE